MICEFTVRSFCKSSCAKLLFRAIVFIHTAPHKSRCRQVQHTLLYNAERVSCNVPRCLILFLFVFAIFIFYPIDQSRGPKEGYFGPWVSTNAICSRGESVLYICEVREEEPQLYAEGLSHSSSAVVIAYQRSFVSVAICPTCGARPARPAGYPRTSRGRLGRSAALTSDDHARRRKEKKRRIIISTTRRDVCGDR